MTESEKLINDINKHENHLFNIKQHRDNVRQKQYIEKKLESLDKSFSGTDSSGYTEAVDKNNKKNHDRYLNYDYNKSAFYWIYKIIFTLIVCGGIVGLLLYIFNSFNEVVYALGDLGIGGVFNEEDLSAMNEAINNTRIRQMLILGAFGVAHLISFLGVLWQRTGDEDRLLKSDIKKGMLTACLITLGLAGIVTYGDYIMGYDALFMIGEEKITFAQITENDPTMFLYPQIAYIAMSVVCLILIFIAWLMDTKISESLSSYNRFEKKGLAAAKAKDKNVYKNDFAKAMKYMSTQKEMLEEALLKVSKEVEEGKKSCLFIKKSKLIDFKDVNEETGDYDIYNYNKIMDLLSIARIYAVERGAESIDQAVLYYEQDEAIKNQKEQERLAKKRAEEKARREAQQRAWEAEQDRLNQECADWALFWWLYGDDD